ncbi:hypothetical protein MMC13_001841 [Lambiella insularis]|nr:hypothetical protein [Lambiella insularis]
MPNNKARDPNTLSNYNDFRTVHTLADLNIDFSEKKLCGSVTLILNVIGEHTEEIVLDTSFLKVHSVRLADSSAEYVLSPRTEPYGSALKIQTRHIKPRIKPGDNVNVEIDVQTTEECTALQWLTPAQTPNKKHPYMFSQCQAIHARSVFPCQDTPAVKSTFEFHIRSPLPVIASGLSTGAKNFCPGENGAAGTLLYTFKQDVPIPSYLFALASGDIAMAAIGPRSTVATGPKELQAAKWELEDDTERFIQTAEVMQLLKLVSGFSTLTVGAENPADKSVHMDYLQCPGASTFLSIRRFKPPHGEPHRSFSAIIGWKALSESIAKFGPSHEFTKLVINLKGQDPDDAFSSIPYEKGFTFLYHLEHLLGKAKWDTFILHYFSTWARRSLDSFEFKATLLAFFAPDAAATALLSALDWDSWFFAPGFPPKPAFDTSLVDVCYALADRWEAYASSPSPFTPKAEDIATWTANQIVVFLERVQDFAQPVAREGVHAMGTVYGFARSRNVEVVSRWLRVGLRAREEGCYALAAELLGRVGRMKFVLPLYRDLKAADPALARKTFSENEEFYHPICRKAVRQILERE